MVETFVAELRSSVSAARLERYRRSGTDFDMVTNYFWNIARVEALFHPLGSVEILLRNAIHRTLSRHYGMTNWYDERGFFEPAQVRQVNDAKRFISDRNRPVTPDRVIAQLTFGFLGDAALSRLQQPLLAEQSSGKSPSRISSCAERKSPAGAD